MPKNKKRLDQYLIENFYFENANEVERFCIAKEIRVGTVYVTSPATFIEIDDSGIAKEEIYIKNQKHFVSRGGLKLQHAIETFNINVCEKKCLDIGSSTGGFTDCLLQNGAKTVTCVDVNYGQLAWRLRQDYRVKIFERLNIKEAKAPNLGAPFDIIVTDVSFISLASLSKVVKSMCCTDSIFIGLIKPQFECRKNETVNGVVLDEGIAQRTVQEVKNAYQNECFEVINTTKSPIKGPSGNTEYLIYCKYSD